MHYMCLSLYILISEILSKIQIRAELNCGYTYWEKHIYTRICIWYESYFVNCKHDGIWYGILQQTHNGISSKWTPLCK